MEVFSERDLECDVASSVLLGEDLTEEEKLSLPAHVQKRAEDYCMVRSHILTLWRVNVTKYLSQNDAGIKVAKRFKPLVPYAWDFLNLHGFINFGAGLTSHPLPGHDGRDPARTVVVIGAGLAGCAAASQLQRWGYRVIVLEGRNRPGGRVHTLRMEGDGERVGVADLGGSIITGINGNPLAVVARQLGIPLHDISGKCPLFLEGGLEPDEELDALAQTQHDGLLDDCGEYRSSMGQAAALISLGVAYDMLWEKLPQESLDEDKNIQLQDLMHWHQANAEFANAANLKALSLSHWDQDDQWEMMGPHVFLPGGNLQLVEGLLKDIPVFYNSTVSCIDRKGEIEDPVTVHSNTGSFQADAVIVTVPLGVLKRGHIRFEPLLPPEKIMAIKRLGFGVLNKLVMFFPHAFWDESCDTFGHVNSSADPSERGLYYLFYSYSELAGGAVLAALVAGEAAVKFEQTPLSEALPQVMKVLREIHEPKGIYVPEPLQAVCTRWGSDPLSFGSYSSVAVGSKPEDYDTLAQSVDNKLFFAGEATSRKWPATMHGAFLSGLREAAKVAGVFREAQEKLQGSSSLPPPVDPDEAEDNATPDKSATKKRRRGRGSEPPPSTSDIRPFPAGPDDNTEESADIQPGTSSESSGKKDREEEEGIDASRLIRLGLALQALFKAEEPDLKFGIFSAFHTVVSSGLQTDDVLEETNKEARQKGNGKFLEQGMSLVRVDLASLGNGPLRPCPVNLALTRRQLCALRDVQSGDADRVSLLTGTMGVSLQGRPASAVVPELERLLDVVASNKGLSMVKLMGGEMGK